MDAKKTETSNKNRGDNQCNHPSLVKVFVMGVPSGNFVCAQCGRLLSSILREPRR